MAKMFCTAEQQFGRAHAQRACPAELSEGLLLLTVTTVMPLSLQVADFGSARFATQEGYHFAEQHPPERAGEVLGSLETRTVRPAFVTVLDHASCSAAHMILDPHDASCLLVASYGVAQFTYTPLERCRSS